MDKDSDDEDGDHMFEGERYDGDGDLWFAPNL